MAGVTDTGFIPKDFDLLKDELADLFLEAFGDDFATTPDSVSGQLISIFAASLKDVWDLGELIADQQNRSTSEGYYLNILAALVGLSRYTASGSTGNLLFTGSQGADVVASFPCSDSLSRNVLTDEALSLQQTACYQATYSVNTVADSTDYTLTIESTEYTYTSGTSATESEILTGLETEVNTASDFSSEVVSSTLVVTYGSSSNAMSTSGTSNLTQDSIGGLVSSTAEDTGDQTFEADSITTLGSSNINIDSVTNPDEFEEGRDDETDEELRIRLSETDSSSGTATLPSIQASLEEVDGVTEVYIRENDTLEEDDDNVPAKSYEVIISGGTEDDIADMIWETKPAGISTYGSVSKVITDDNGDEQTVYFSRKADTYAWVYITYSLNTEETFPDDGEDTMITAVVDYGDEMESGEDFAPTKFYAPLYEAVDEGMYVESITIATTSTSTGTPTYQTSRISVDADEYLNFSSDRVTVEVTT